MFLLILALTSGFRLLLALYRRLFVVLSFTNLSDNTISRARSLKALESRIEAFIFADFNLCHVKSPPFATDYRG